MKQEATKWVLCTTRYSEEYKCWYAKKPLQVFFDKEEAIEAKKIFCDVYEEDIELAIIDSNKVDYPIYIKKVAKK